MQVGLAGGAIEVQRHLAETRRVQRRAVQKQEPQHAQQWLVGRKLDTLAVNLQHNRRFGHGTVYMSAPPILRVVRADSVLLELFLSCYTLVWGLWKIWPGGSFVSSTYNGMAALASEQVWGVGIAILGIVGLLATATDHYRWRLTMLALNAALWAFVTLLIGQSSWWLAGGIPHFSLVWAACLFVALRLWRW